MCISSSTSNQSRLFGIPWIIPDRRSFLENSPVRRPSATPGRASDMDYAKHELTVQTIRRRSKIVRDQAQTGRPQARTVQSLKNQKNTKGMGSVKCIFSVLANRPRCTARSSVSAFRPRGSLDRWVNCRYVSQPRWIGARRNTRGNNKGNHDSCCPAPRADALAVGGYKRSRGREWGTGRQAVLPRDHLFVRGPWTFLL
jgi:hypothetical protein